MGIKGHNAELDDVSQENEALFVKAYDIREKVLAYDDEDLNDDEQLSKEITLYLLDSPRKAISVSQLPVNQLSVYKTGFQALWKVSIKLMMPT